MADFIHTGTWLVALGGAVLAIFVYELARSMRAVPSCLGGEAEAGRAGRPEGKARGTTGW